MLMWKSRSGLFTRSLGIGNRKATLHGMEGRSGGFVEYIMGLGKFASLIVLQNLVGRSPICARAFQCWVSARTL
jgi:hypothetical protein